MIKKAINPLVNSLKSALLFKNVQSKHSLKLMTSINQTSYHCLLKKINHGFSQQKPNDPNE